MISADLAMTIREQVASEVKVEIESADRFSVSTPLRYSDGDHFGFVFVRNAQGGWNVVDEGEVLIHAGYSGVDLLGRGRAERFRRTAEFYGLHESDGELILSVPDDNSFGDAVFQFAQASLVLSALSQVPAERTKTASKKFRKELKEVVEMVFPHVDKRWSDAAIDPHGIHRVDYRIPSAGRELFVFGANSEVSCLRSAVTCLRYRQAEFPFIGVAVYNNEEALPPNSAASLDEVSDRQFSLATERDELEAFLRSPAA